MKDLILIVLTLFLGATAFNQNAETKKSEDKPVKKQMGYCCPKCDYCSSAAGTCPHHKINLEASETETKYCCPHCDWEIPPVKGICPHSTASLYKDGTLHCVMLHNKGGKCPKCGMEMEKIEIKKKKDKKEK